jgi:hypothetical protein
MSLKFNLNKFCKVDNIEGYTLACLRELQKEYSKFLENADGVDPDFPMFNFGGGKGKKVNGQNAARFDEELEERDKIDYNNDGQ